MGTLGTLTALGTPAILAVPAAAASRPVPVAPRPAAAPPATADVSFRYGAPLISPDGEHVTWRWTLRNGGPGTAREVVLVHRLTPRLKVSRMSKECRAFRAAISCSYGTMPAGRRRTGTLEAELRDASGTVEINGRVTWQQG